MDSGEGQCHFRLDGDRPDDLHVPGLPHGVAEQRGLAHTGLTPQDQRAARAPADGVEDLAERLRLRPAVEQPHPGGRSPDRSCGTVPRTRDRRHQGPQPVDRRAGGAEDRVHLGEAALRRRVSRHPTRRRVEPGPRGGEVPPAQPHEPAPELQRGDREGRDPAVPGPGTGGQVLRLGVLPALGLEHGQRPQGRDVGPSLGGPAGQRLGLDVAPERREDCGPLGVERVPVSTALSRGVEVGERLREPVEGAPRPRRPRARRGRAARPARRHVRSPRPGPGPVRAAGAGRSASPGRRRSGGRRDR